MDKEIVAKSWHRYAETVYPHGMSADQENQLRKAWYAAWLDALGAVHTVIKCDASNEAKVNVMNGFMEEVHTWITNTIRKEAEMN